MQAYIIRRLLLVIPTLLFMGSLLFFLMQAIPGDVALAMLSGEESAADPEQIEKLREELGLNDPVLVQYGRWLWTTLRGDLGFSPYFRRPVRDALSRMEVTATLAILGVVIAVAWAIPLGIVSALTRGKWLDHAIRAFSALGLSVPGFWIGLMTLILLVRFFNWIPPVQHAHFLDDPLAALKRYLIPGFIIGLRSASVMARVTRSMTLEVLGEDYIRTARAKGLFRRIVVMRHALPNALIPVVTMASLLLGGLVEGAVVIETIFLLPGIGVHLLAAVAARDIITVQGIVLAIGAFVLVWILLTDLMYAWLDPRIRYE